MGKSSIDGGFSNVPSILTRQTLYSTADRSDRIYPPPCFAPEPIIHRCKNPMSQVGVPKPKKQTSSTCLWYPMVWGARAPPIAGYCHHVFYFTLFSQHFHSKKASQSPSRPPSTAFFRICRPVGTGAQGTRGFCRTGQSPAVEPCTWAPQSFLGAGLQASDFIGCSSEKSLGIGPMRPTNRVTCRLNIEKMSIWVPNQNGGIYAVPVAFWGIFDIS